MAATPRRPSSYASDGLLDEPARRAAKSVPSTASPRSERRARRLDSAGVRRRLRAARPGAAPALAFLAGAASFAAMAVAVAVGGSQVPSLLLAVAAVLAPLAVVRVWGVAYVIPVAAAALLSFDWFYVPPTHPFAVPDLTNSAQALIYLAIAVLAGQFAATAVRRAQESEAARIAVADEQAALRRVATLVAQGVPPAEVFAAVAREVGLLLRVDAAYVGRFDLDGTVTCVAGWSQAGNHLPVDTQADLDGESVSALVLRTGHAARMSNYENTLGPIAALLRDLGIRSSVGAPIVVDGDVWGTMVVSSRKHEPLPSDTETRTAAFAKLVATAIANADARAELAASRARVVSAADETRRRLERDLHDGTQQGLVSLALELRTVQAMLPSGENELGPQLSRIGEDLADVIEDVREISRGLHPAILSKGGLEPALRALARRCAVRVDLDVRVGARLPENVEVAAYYVVSEGLANVVKHAAASVMKVVVETVDGTVRLCICDDGRGGADPTRGSGLIGLKDRVDALGGTMSVVSPVDGGTTLRVSLPVAPSG